MHHMNPLQSAVWPGPCYTYFQIIGIYPWINMPPTSYISVPLHYYCGPHIDLTLLDVQVQKSVMLKYHGFAIYVPTTKMPLKCHICQIVHVQISGYYISVYTSYELNTINKVTTCTSIHTFTLLAYIHQHIHLQYSTYMFHCTSSVVYIQTPHYFTCK